MSMADTQQPEFSLARFEALVAAYGGDFSRYPVRERAGAEALVARSRDARRIFEAARAFDSLLRSARAELPPRLELMARRGASPIRHAPERSVVALLPFRSRGRAWLAAAAAMLLGIAGSRVLPEEARERTTEQADMSALGFVDELFEELVLEGGTG